MKMNSKIVLSVAAMLTLTSCGDLELGNMVNFGGDSAPQATGFSKITPPSSLPPEGYISNQWTDNRGCQFLRVGSGSWAPRVTQDGRHYCSAAAAIPTPTVEPTPAEPKQPVEPTQPTPKPVEVVPVQPETPPVAPAQPEPVAPTQPEPAAPAQPEPVAPTQPEATPSEPSTGGLVQTAPGQMVVIDNSLSSRDYNSFIQVQVGAFAVEENAIKVISNMRNSGYQVYVVSDAKGVRTIGVFAQIGQSAAMVLNDVHEIGYTEAILVE